MVEKRLDTMVWK